MPLKLGANEFNAPLLKVYCGNELIWEEEPSEIEFTSCPFPTSWTHVSNRTSYKASNSYGTWNISSSSYYDTAAQAIFNAFDNNTSTYWASSRSTQTNHPISVQIDCPIYIKPEHIYLIYQGIKNCTLSGYNPVTSTWETIYNLPNAGDSGDSTLNTDLTIENYYSKFKFYGYINTYLKCAYITEFKITSGCYKLPS